MGGPVTVAKASIEDRERILDELRRHLGVPETGGEGSLTVVVRGVRLEVNLRVTKMQTADELAALRTLLDNIMASEPWRIGTGQCGTILDRKVSAFSRRNRTCAKSITTAVLYTTPKLRPADVPLVSALLYCPYHERRHGVDPHKLVGIVPLSKEDKARYRKQLDEHNAREAERRRVQQLTRAVSQ